MLFKKCSLIIFSTLFLFNIGCTSKSQLFVNSNGDVKRCASYGYGLAGVIQADNIQSDCEQDMLNLGYKKIEMAGVVGISYNDSLKIIKVKYIASKKELKESFIPESQQTKMFDEAMYKITLRTIHELFEADSANAIEAISFNGWIKAINNLLL